MALKTDSVQMLKLLSEREGPFERVLDVGCGGRIYEPFIDAGEYIGIDVEESGHDRTGKIVDRFFDGTSIPFDDDRFDLVLCTEVLEHAVDAEKLFAEMKRVLKPNAALFLTVPYIWGEHEVPYDFRRYTTYGIRRQVELLDMELVSLEKGSPGVSALIKLGISEIRYSRTTSALSKRLSRYWLKATQIILERILWVEMERIYLRNIAVIRKRATG